MTTVALGLVKEVAAAARAPRFLYLHWPFGHALGEPGNVLQQRTVLGDMLSMAVHAPRPGMVVELPYRWRREKYEPIADWSTPSQVLVAALKSARLSEEEARTNLLGTTEGMLKR
ncbi:MAG TPA: hypothetical protein VN577_18565 [Terriglobales bacterium]|nr:hypothetical protein [Terriglobales bacterium]